MLVEKRCMNGTHRDMVVHEGMRMKLRPRLLMRAVEERVRNGRR